MASSVRKRDGSVVPFDLSKIRDAMFLANICIADERMTEEQLQRLAARVGDTWPATMIPLWKRSRTGWRKR